MLTRYRELYNSLTNSKAFKPVGSMDNDKVNKNTFTPHNLKSIILGFNGYVAVRFTTNKVESKRVYLRPFYNKPRNDEEYKESLKEKKGMIDALIDGYKFNYLEEIILFTGGFRQEDLTKEMQRIQHFVSHHITSFKRLSGIYRVDAVINDDLQNIVPNKSVVEQLKSIGLSVIPMIEQQVHRTELGLLERPGLDSSKYVLDSEYKPDLPDAEKGKEIYRLSKYFYDEEQQAIKARKAFLEKKAEQKKADEDAAKKAEEEQKQKELRKSMKKLYAQYLKFVTENVIGAYSQLYKTGFSGFPQEGLLCPNRSDSSPIIVLNKTNKQIACRKVDGGTMGDKDILDAITVEYPQLTNCYKSDSKNLLPSIEELIKSDSKPYVLVYLHLLLQTADIDSTAGNDLISIRKWVTDTKEYTNAEDWIQKENNGKRRLTKWEDVKSWYRWVLENIYIESLINYGVVGTTDDEQQKAIKVAKTLIKHLKNVIVVSERDSKDFSSTEVRISANVELDSNKIVDRMKAKLNQLYESGQEVVEVSERGQNENNVKIISVVFDKKSANKSTSFAGEIIDKIIESGNVPSWSNAIIGKKEDGSLMQWKGFMHPDVDKYSRCYTIYASSGSGKGIMTSTLVASALCDNKQVFYTDGKPENGATMGMVAWEQGKEAYVFDGKAEGNKPFDGYMEQYASPVRTVGEVEQYYDNFNEELQKSLFSEQYFDRNKKLKFLGLMRYLKSLYLCADIIYNRAHNHLPMNEWQVWIFDEVTSMSLIEVQIRNIFRQYCDSRGVSCSSTKIAPNKPITALGKISSEMLNPNSDKYDAGIAYIKNWLDWTGELYAKVQSAAVIELRKASSNLIFIFQEPSWLADGEHGTVTTIGQVVSSLNSMKIVGKGGIVNGAGQYGDGNTKGYWVEKINAGTGHWAISKTTNIREGARLFKPFNIWTVPLDGNGIMKSDEGLDEARKSRYFKGYITKLANSFGINPAEVIESAYNYADEAVRTLGLTNGSLKDYIYDCNMYNDSVSNNYATLDVDSVEDEDPATARLNKAISNFDSEYHSIINKIITDSHNLDKLPRKEGKEVGFATKQAEILNNFSGKYSTDKKNFLQKVGNSIKNEELKNQVLQAYNNKFNEDFERLYQEIAAKKFEVAPTADDYTTSTTSSNNGYSSSFNSDERPQRPTRQQPSQSSRAYQQPQEQTQRTKNSIVKDRYTGKIEVKDNPFTKYVNGTTVDTMLTVKDLTKIMVKDIRQNVCPDDMIKSFYITKNKIVINNIAYTPTFDDSFMSSLPMSLRVKVEQGQLVEFFDLGHIYHYRYLEDFRIYDEYLAQGRARKEMGIGFRKRWNVLFNKMDNLMFIKMGDVEYTRDNPDETAEMSILDKFKNNEGLTYAQGNRKTMMDRVWDSKPVRVMTGAFGWTMGVKMVWTLAALAGPWGLLFGAFAMAGAYKELKKKQDTSQDNKSN